jgi:hypothetical protein
MDKQQIRQTTNFRLLDEQMVNGLRKSFPGFLFSGEMAAYIHII